MDWTDEVTCSPLLAAVLAAVIVLFTTAVENAKPARS